VTAAAAGTAWLVADAASARLGAVSAPAVVAAITAVLVVRTSLHRSASDAWAQILATALGAAAALVVVHLGVASAPAAAVVVGVSLVTAKVLRLGVEAGFGVPVTALIVLGPGVQESTAADRFVATAIGAAVAVVFSFFTHPGTPAGRTALRVGELGSDAADVLSAASKVVSGGLDLEEALGVLEQARLLSDDVPGIRDSADEALGYARWFPSASRTQASAVYARFLGAEHAAVSVRAIARTVVELAERDVDLPGPASVALSDALKCGARALGSSAEAVETSVDLAVEAAQDEPLTGELVLGPLPRPVAGRVDALLQACAELSGQAAGLFDGDRPAGPLLATVAVLLERVADSVGLESEALRQVAPSPQAAPVVQAAGQVLTAARLPARGVRGLRERRQARRSEAAAQDASRSAPDPGVRR
jgi:hypothetical protein